MKLDYPDFLGGIFRDLEWYGAFLRREHGPGTRRNIRFDEENVSLYMDILLPGENKNWLRVSPKMARDERNDHQRKNEMSTRMQLRPPGIRPRTTPPEARNLGGDDRGRKRNDEEQMDFDPNFAGFPGSYRSPRKTK